ncbi:hypothetical protein [Novipirellula artificiosorum]|uniref:Uncharacterized protein n=1 Tax=Novipirellula artificiosorum TaxID=2528016 RepID=A0A5C6D7J4_9BACT|nr:hypothetical protein [Novipirellula artificiosorum]TWU32902.1 hypothetical protein Poly41_52800 [Novipirellula artificiosorum]
MMKTILTRRPLMSTSIATTALSIWILLLTPATSVAQDGGAGEMGGGGYDGGDEMGGDDYGSGYGEVGRGVEVKFVILLGPNLKSGEKPFLDAYELSRAASVSGGASLPISQDAIDVDLKTPLPTDAGISAQGRYPQKWDKEELDQFTTRIRAQAIRFGITDVRFEPFPEETAKKTPRTSRSDRVSFPFSEVNAKETAFVRVPVRLGRPDFAVLTKAAAAARALDAENPKIELFNAPPPAQHAGGYGDGMYGGMGDMYGMSDGGEMYGGMDMMYGGGDMDGGYGGGMMGSDMETPTLVDLTTQLEMQREALQQAEVALESLRQKSIDSKNDSEKQQLELKIREQLLSAFNVRQWLQQAQAEQLSRKLSDIEERMRQRQSRRDEIIENRLKEMLDRK